MPDEDASEPVPALENGDRLTLPEFERRYEAMPAVKKAELIEGEVFMPSPAGLRRHGRPHIHVVAWLGTYVAGTPGLIPACNPSVRLDLDNAVQPDVLLMIEPDRGGQTRISEDDFVERAPELVVEVAASSVSIELHKKLHVYRRSGVLEYVVWRVLDRKVDWFVLRDGDFIRLDPDEKGRYRSRTFPGLWLDARVLVEGDLAIVLDVLRQGLATPEHAIFVSDLAARSSGPRS
jgi:Uma2 family endonuclease